MLFIDQGLECRRVLRDFNIIIAGLQAGVAEYLSLISGDRQGW